MLVSDIDQQIGIKTYVTKTEGIGGKIKQDVEDFVVEENLIDGSTASTMQVETKPVLNVSSTKKRFLLCLLIKRNWDTFIALKKIARELDIEESRIQIAGIKDAKATTAQHLTIENLTKEEISKVNIKDIELLPVGYFHEPISSFYLLGNSFTIKVREIDYPKNITEKTTANCIEEIKATGGIPNFYGHQRFGTTRPITHLVGKAIIKGDLEEAAMLFLAKPSPNEHPESMQARAQLQTDQNFAKALNNFPTQLRFERIMLRHLASSPQDFQGAFRRLPAKLRLLFVHAWQSFLFNRFLSNRIQNGSSFTKAEVGDFIVNVERSGLPLIQTGKIVNSANVSEVNSKIESGKMRIALPIIGFKQRLSEGVMGDLEKQILEEEEIELRCFRIQSMPELGVKGNLRAAFSPVHSFNTFIQELANKSELSIEFRLLRGSYATILLREIMKPNDPIEAGY
jgi:tRNA pseudouridine13 synthase